MMNWNSNKSAIVIGTMALLFASASAQAATVVRPDIKANYLDRNPLATIRPNTIESGPFTESRLNPVPGTPGSPVGISFEGISQYDNAALGRNSIPPDTNGAVGLNQYFEVSNGSYAVFNKNTGAKLALISDVAFWAAAGQVGASGDSRVLYNADAKRWVVVSFGGNVKDLQIAVSDTDNALGPWKSTKFEGYAGLGFGATADYPTLSLDKNAVLIGTNNFAPASAGGANRFRGTTLNVIPINSIFNALAPTTNGINQLVTTLTNTSNDSGFAIQGVNSSTARTSSLVVANSLFFNDDVAYLVNGLTPNSAAGATQTGSTYLNQTAYQDAGKARQPSPNVANRRIIDALDQRISSSVYEANGRIYLVQTVDSSLDSLDEARVRYTVLDSNTFAILDEGDIGSAGYDYFQGSIAVNKSGQVVIGYNRSGAGADGKISFFAQTFKTSATGKLVSVSGELFLKESLTDDYHNGSLAGQNAAGRQRWGDYSQVSIDPSQWNGFYVIGQFAREFNNAAGGHPGGSGGSRWGTWIASVNAGAVPEPATWAMMIAGFGLVGGAMRRRRTTVAFQTA